MIVTRRDLRRDIAQQLHDVLTLTATAGSNNMLVDPVELTDYDSTFTGSQAVCISAAHPDNVGRIVRVVGNSQSGTNISFTPSLPQDVSAGDVFELYNLRGRGFRVQDYNNQIESVVKSHQRSAPRRADSDPVVFEFSNPFVDIPEDWISIHGVSVLVNGFTYDVHCGRYDGARGWRVDQTGRRVEISGSDRGVAHGQEVVLHGHTGHPPVTNDSDRIYLNPEFVMRMVSSNLASRRGGRDLDQWAAEWARMAAGVRPAVQPAWPANTVMVNG